MIIKEISNILDTAIHTIVESFYSYTKDDLYKKLPYNKEVIDTTIDFLSDNDSIMFLESEILIKYFNFDDINEKAWDRYVKRMFNLKRELIN